ncbi:glycosyltransferase [Fulvivirga sp. RKSG066]|uniref:TIGR04283 family arsenosugar biosynthesis glycosyltransferase n=1 Tax=Fulvivirga aurantia TaxID=2529383 RepID=UPI0012BBADCB|nr:TIGR04283 family arsenosugar biosynthesis glycosyltransferase [Fulvivirga aurantia]MTI19956.1 glycosyltransferase [Fulvivirga aurantia]
MISLIIPTFNEERRIADLINYLRDNAGLNIIEILVVDGGSSDQTVLAAEAAGAEVHTISKKSRAVQMNYAVSQVKGEVIYFVHADTRPPKNYGQLIDGVIRSGKKAGCFTSIFDWNHPFLRFCNFFSRLPFWFCRGGGQTLFVEKELFLALGGFDESMILMEEYDFISRVKKETNFAIIKKNAVTSARDYRVNGAFKLQFIYSYVFFLYSIGAPQEKMLAVVRKYVTKA